MGWSARDRGLAEALVWYERDLDEHGLPSHIAHDPERSWEVDEIVNHPAAVLAEAHDEMRDGKGKNYGVRLTVQQVEPRRSVAPLDGDADAEQDRA